MEKARGKKREIDGEYLPDSMEAWSLYTLCGWLRLASAAFACDSRRHTYRFSLLIDRLSTRLNQKITFT